jgi:hypothetical protein
MRLLGAWTLYGLVFFSVARNKLPGYLLPLLPGMAILLAAAWGSAPFKTFSRALSLAACALLLVVLPTVTAILPDALLTGLSRARLAFSPGGLIFLPVALAVWWIAKRDHPEAAFLMVGVAAGFGVTYLKYTTFPTLDTIVSVRNFWRSNKDLVSMACLDNVGRTWQYGMNYYEGRELPNCTPADPGPRISIRERQLSLVSPK